jgi:hypothetical protein
MILAAFAVGSLLFVTWAMMRVSAWIVFHDSVWQQMDHEGASLEHYLAEAFLQARSVYVLPMEAFCGVVFLVLVWRCVSRRQPQNGEGADK